MLDRETKWGKSHSWQASLYRHHSLSQRRQRPRGLSIQRLEDRTLLAVDVGFAFGLGSAGAEVRGGLALDAPGNVYVAGTFHETVDFDPGPGTFQLTGNSPSFFTEGGDIFIAKYSPTSQLIWARALTASEAFLNSTVQVDAAGSVYVSGTAFGIVDLDPGPGEFVASTVQDGFVVKLDAQGEFLWAEVFEGDGDVRVVGMGLDGTDHIYLTGGYSGDQLTDLDPGPGTVPVPGRGAFVVKLTSSTGEFVWAAATAAGREGEFSSGVGNAVAVDALGNVHVGGVIFGAVDFDPGPETLVLSAGETFGNSMFVWKLDSNGNSVWARAAGAPGGVPTPRVHGIAVDSAGNVYAAGALEGTVDFDPGPVLEPAGHVDGVLWRLDSEGNFLGAHQFGSPGGDLASGVAVDSAGAVYVSGWFQNTADFDPGPGVFELTSAGIGDFFVVKLQTDGTFVWAVRAGGPEHDRAGLVSGPAFGGPDIAVDNEGNVYTTGDFSGTADFDPGADALERTSNGSFDVFVWKLTQGPEVVPVEIDIKPGGDPTSINLANNGVIAVALFTTADFDAATVDVSTVIFAGAAADHWALEDVDGDGDLDMVLHFRTQDTNLRTLYEQLLADDDNADGVLDSNRQAAEVSLTGQTTSDVFFEGFDEADLFLSGKALRTLLAELAAAGAI